MPIDETQYLQTDGGRLAYRVTQGDRDKATLVWMSGLRLDTG